MAKRSRKTPVAAAPVAKSPTGIEGLDEVTGGGLPMGRPTLVTGSAGCGKTLLGMEFLVRGARQFNEPGLFVSFEEREQELIENVASLGFAADELMRRKLLSIDYVRAEPSEIEETGEHDLEGLFVRLGFAIDAIGAKRVVLDTIEALFAALPNPRILRAELRRLFRWLKDRGVTAIVTAERGEGTFTRHGLEEYVSDCVIMLDHRVIQQVSTRRLRVVKYRGTAHGTNEYPFLIDANGFSVLPITSIALDHTAPTERMSCGIPQLDTMLGDKGLYRGSSVLVSGTAGSGKTSIAAHLVHAACARGERCLYFPFEESPRQILRNMASIGIDLRPWLERDLLRFHATRPQAHGLEMHLAVMHREVDRFEPAVVVIDPVSNLADISSGNDARAMLTRLVDLLKHRGITALYTSLTVRADEPERTDVAISSLMDTWVLLRNLESNGERNRGLYVLKSRGMGHSNQVREFRLTNHGADLREIYTGPAGVLFGSARVVQERRDTIEQQKLRADVQRRQRELESRRAAVEAQIASLRASCDAEAAELQAMIEQGQQAHAALESQREQLSVLRAGTNGSGKREKRATHETDNRKTKARRQGQRARQ
jgi:circadian clock protein KaiC